MRRRAAGFGPRLRLDSTLMMHGHRLGGVTVVRGTVPMIDAYADELNQVWTNLINNAVDAMRGLGTLRGHDAG
ncbi:MAG TPA: hypothetical protein VF241_05415 [Propionibacteriaceae bacterium]